MKKKLVETQKKRPEMKQRKNRIEIQRQISIKISGKVGEKIVKMSKKFIKGGTEN